MSTKIVDFFHYMKVHLLCPEDRVCCMEYLHSLKMDANDFNYSVGAMDRRIEFCLPMLSTGSSRRAATSTYEGPACKRQRKL